MVELCSANYFMNKPAPWELCSVKRLLGNSRHRSGDIQCKQLPGLRGRLALLGHRVMNRVKSKSIVKLLVSMALLGSMDPICLGQTPAFRIYLPNLAEEDWSFLKDRSKSVDFWDPVKYISLGAEDRFLTLAGEIRFRPEGFRIRGTGDIPTTRDGYLLQRYLLGADFHLNRRFRFYTEIQSGLINGRLNSPRPTDKNSLDLHQTFFEWKEKLREDREFILRAGRQELTIGSSRLISASPGLNVKRSFDGVVLAFKGKTWHVDAGFARLVALSQGVFDDLPDHEQTFWGIALARRSSRVKQGQVPFMLRVLAASSVTPLEPNGPPHGRDSTSTMTVSFSGEPFPARVSRLGLSRPKRATGFPRRTGSRASLSGQTVPRETKIRLIPDCRHSTRCSQGIAMLEPLDCSAPQILPT